MTKTEAKKILTMGNHKLGGSIASFSLPVSKDVCGRVCDGCYALKPQIQYPAVLPSRLKKLELSKRDEFVTLMLGALEALRPDFIRIHDSGEYYSQVYIDKWVDIIKKAPNTIAYAYTKRFADFDFSVLKSLPNMVLINSLHGGKINYGPKEKRPLGMFLCPDHKNSPERIIQPKDPICGTLCTYCMTKSAEDTGVYFVQH